MPIHILQDGLLPKTIQGGKGIDKWDMIPRSFRSAYPHTARWPFTQDYSGW